MSACGMKVNAEHVWFAMHLSQHSAYLACKERSTPIKSNQISRRVVRRESVHVACCLNDRRGWRLCMLRAASTTGEGGAGLGFTGTHELAWTPLMSLPLRSVFGMGALHWDAWLEPSSGPCALQFFSTVCPRPGPRV